MLLVTGASGYLGRAALRELVQHGHSVRTTSRLASVEPGGDVAFYDMGSEEPPPVTLFEGISSVLHCAGLAHRRATESEYQEINVTATAQLAEAAATAGVAQFVFVSSMNIVPAEAGAPDAVATVWPAPCDPYSASKWRAEKVLSQVLGDTACELTVVRPGLIYDQELTANLATLQRLLSRLPVRLPAVGCRTMVSRSDLARLLVEVLSGRCGASVGQPILVASDGERYDAARISRSVVGGRLQIPVPSFVLRSAGLVMDWRNGLSAGATWQNLAHRFWCGPAPKIPGWEPSVSLESCLGQVTE